jgi:hypothetical protein
MYSDEDDDIIKPEKLPYLEPGKITRNRIEIILNEIK